MNPLVVIRNNRLVAAGDKRSSTVVLWLWPFVLRATLLCFLLTVISIETSVASSPEDDVLPQPCASDPVYAEFEKVQAYAYQSDKYFRILLNHDLNDKVRFDAQNALDRLFRDKSVQKIGGGAPPYFGATKTPTCYENPILYSTLQHVAADIETARQQLRLSIIQRPRFGTLPSNDINAYTYPFAEGNVIAINVQLVWFINTMTKLAVGAVNPALDGKDPDAKVIATALMAISYNPQAKEAFIASMIGLLRGRPIEGHGISLSPSQTLLAAFIAGASERFVFAHEYGHLLKKRHTSHKRSAPVGVTGSQQFEVYARSWAEEFEADAKGLELLVEVLRGAVAENPDAARYFLLGLRAPLFFFECMELLDQAKALDISGSIPARMTEEDRSLIRHCAELTDAKPPNEKCAATLNEDHPPAWLRQERLRKLINQKLAELPHSEEAIAASKVDELVFTIDLFWRETSQQILLGLTQTR